MGNLTAAQVKNAKPSSTLIDGDGLRLRVDGKGRRKWVYRYQRNGKSYSPGCGGHNTTLSQARAKRDELKAQLLQGTNPVIANATAKATRTIGTAELSSSSSVLEVGEVYVAVMGAEWTSDKHRSKWLNMLKKHCSQIMRTPIGDVTKQQLLNALDPIWAVKTITAQRCQQKLKVIFDFAAGREIYSGQNPAEWDRLKFALPSVEKIHKVEHFSSLPYNELPRWWRNMEATATDASSVQCLRFIILTGARSNEARGASWSEIDFGERVWRVPADRMKNRMAHTVPLSRAAMKVLKVQQELASLHPDSDLVFPAPTRGNELSQAAVEKSAKRYFGKVTPHGFRSTFKNWSLEQTDYDDLVSEFCLAHKDKDKVRAAYLRSSNRTADQSLLLIEKRRSLLEEWARFTTGGGKSTHDGKVVDINSRAG